MKYILPILLLSISLLYSCNSDTQTPTKPQATKTEKKTETAPKSASSTNQVTLEISSNDQMKYDKAELRAKAGQEVTLVLKHTGKMAKEVMGHNWVLLKAGTDITAFATKSMKAKATDYIPEGDETIAYTKTIGGGESTQVSFTAPEKGEYDFICSFPAHYALMKGKFIVE